MKRSLRSLFNGAWQHKSCCSLFFILVLFAPASAQHCGPVVTAPGTLVSPGAPAPGYVLYAPDNDTMTYLMDKKGNVVHAWKSKYPPGMAVYLLPNGNLLRAEDLGNHYCGYPGGRIAMYDWCGELLWKHDINNDQNQQSHDIYPISSTNVLVAVWEKISYSEAKQMNRNINSNDTSIGLWSAKVVELQQLPGTKKATPVWEWRFWDHLVSNPDSVNLLPRRLNVNYIGTPTGPDNPSGYGDTNWIHMNAVVYNPALDQILISSRNLNEFYIIEHTKHRKIAAGRSGGKYGHGGDFLYRWGSPAAYGQSGLQQLFGQHSPYWLDTTTTGGNEIMINNDGFGRPGSPKPNVCITSANIMQTPIIGTTGNYYLPATGVFGPDTSMWTYMAPPSMGNCFQGSAQLLPNGNVLMDDALQGIFYEVDPAQNVVWQFTLNSGEGAAFRCHQYEPDYVNPLLKGSSNPKPKNK